MLDLAIRFFADELLGAKRTGHTKEQTCIREVFAGKKFYNNEPAEKWSKEYDGFWCIDEGEPFVLFRSEALACEWLKCLETPR